MKRLKEFLTSFLKSNGNVYRYIARAVVIVAGLIIFCCEISRRVRAEVEAEKAGEIIKKKDEFIDSQNEKYDSVVAMTEYLKIEVDGVKVENNAYRDSMLKVDSIFNSYSKSNLKDAFSKYKGYRMRNSR